MPEPRFRFVCAPSALSGAPVGWAQELLVEGELSHVFMDLSSYDQIPVPSATVGDAAKYMLPEAEVTVATDGLEDCAAVLE